MFDSQSPEIGFADAMREAGLSPPPAIEADGEIHRFPSNGKPNDLAAWYCLHGDAPAAGAFGDWRSGLQGTWCSVGTSSMSETDRAAYQAKMEAVKAQAKAERDREHAEAAARAKSIWEASKPAPADHPYLTRKGVQPHGLRIDSEGRLVMPLHIGPDLVSLQTIDAEGGKLFLKDGIKKGASFTIPGRSDGGLCR